MTMSYIKYLMICLIICILYMTKHLYIDRNIQKLTIVDDVMLW